MHHPCYSKIWPRLAVWTLWLCLSEQGSKQGLASIQTWQYVWMQSYSWIAANNRFIGHGVGRVQLIFCIAPPKGQSMIRGLGLPIFLAYICGVTWHCASSWITTFSLQTSRPWSSHQHASVRLEQSYRSNSSLVGDIVPLRQLWGPVQLTPMFGKKAHICLTAYVQ